MPRKKTTKVRKFEVGDKARVIVDDDSVFPKGEIVKVVKVDSHEPAIYCYKRGKMTWYMFSDELELIKPAPKKKEARSKPKYKREFSESGNSLLVPVEDCGKEELPSLNEEKLTAEQIADAVTKRFADGVTVKASFEVKQTTDWLLLVVIAAFSFFLGELWVIVSQQLLGAPHP